MFARVCLWYPDPPISCVRVMRLIIPRTLVRDCTTHLAKMRRAHDEETTGMAQDTQDQGPERRSLDAAAVRKMAIGTSSTGSASLGALSAGAIAFGAFA